MLSARELIAGVMFRSLLAAAEAKWTAAGQWNQTDRAGANENPETNAVFALHSALAVLRESARRDAVNRQRPITRAFTGGSGPQARKQPGSAQGVEGENKLKVTSPMN
jgi:hypothetical protein